MLAHLLHDYEVKEGLQVREVENSQVVLNQIEEQIVQVSLFLGS